MQQNISMRIDPINIVDVGTITTPTFLLNSINLASLPASYTNREMSYAYTTNTSEGATGQKKIVGSLNESMPNGAIFSLILESAPGATSKGETVLGEVAADLVTDIPVPSHATRLSITANCKLVQPISTSFTRILTLTLMDN